MEKTMANPQLLKGTSMRQHLKNNLNLILAAAVLTLAPFIIGILSGQSPASVLAGESGTSKFLQGLMIEIFILGVYALSYDLIMGITGLLSFGHAMFFAVGAYATGIMLKTFKLPLWEVVLLVIVFGILQALLFAIVLPRVKGITFALVTLGLSSVFYIIIQTREVGDYTGADVGLQGIPKPEFLNPSLHTLRFYFIVLIFMLGVYLIYRRFVNSPTGRVCLALRENEGRARMLGYNTFYFKLVALTISSVTAALAGMFYALYQPIVSPHVAGLAYTVSALLIILIGGVGTLSGAIIGAAVYRLLDFGLDRYIGQNATFVNGAIYVLIVLFVPYGIVGTWMMKKLEIKKGWERILKLVGVGK